MICGRTSSLINYCTTTRLYRKGAEGSWRKKNVLEKETLEKKCWRIREATEEVLDERKCGQRRGAGENVLEKETVEEKCWRKRDYRRGAR